MDSFLYYSEEDHVKNLLWFESQSPWRGWDQNAPALNGLVVVCIDMMNPLISRLPDYGSDPEAEVGSDQVDEAEPSEEAEPLHDDLGVDEEEVHLEEGEESL